MLNSLKFVQGAVGRKDFIPELKHFKIASGFVHSFDGVIALCSPIPLDIECMPKAVPFIKAISNCGEQVALVLRDNGKLNIKSGKFTVNIDCLTEDYPFTYPTGEEVKLDNIGFIKAIKTLEPFIGNDASRMWSNGILFNGHSAFATNNVIIVEHWLGVEFPIKCNIPIQAVRELVRINEEPTSIQYDSNTITFHFKGDRWLKTSQYSVEWPDINKLLNVESNCIPLDSEFFSALEHVKPFVGDMGQIYINNNVISTSNEESEGARYELSNSLGEWVNGVYQIQMLEKLKGVADVIDLTMYPSPSMFYGGSAIRGAIVGMRNV